MSESTPLPSEEKVRELTADPNLAPEEANRYGNMFAEAGKHPQAIMFCERTKDTQVLGRVKEHAVRAGDAFLLHSITRLVADFVKEGEWMECGEKARSEGKLIFARDCFETAGDSEKAASVHEEWLKIFEVDKPKPPAKPAAPPEEPAPPAPDAPPESAAPAAPPESAAPPTPEA